MKSEDLLRFDIEMNPGYRESRKRIILQKIRMIEPAPSHFGLLRFVRFAALAAVLIAVFLPVLRRSEPQVPQTASVMTRDVPFELQKINDEVRLSWKGSPEDKYRIYKGPTPANMKPVQLVKGTQQWIDRSPDSSPITFYRIEEL